VHLRRIRQQPPPLFPIHLEQQIAASTLGPNIANNTTPATLSNVIHPKKPDGAQNDKNNQQTPIADNSQQLKKAAKEHEAAAVVAPDPVTPSTNTTVSAMTTATVTTELPTPPSTSTSLSSTPVSQVTQTTTSQPSTTTTIDAPIGVKKQLDMITQSVWKKVGVCIPNSYTPLFRLWSKRHKCRALNSPT